MADFNVQRIDTNVPVPQNCLIQLLPTNYLPTKFLPVNYRSLFLKCWLILDISVLDHVPYFWYMLDSSTGILLKNSASIEKSILLKNFASIEKRKICLWLLNNPASDCWRIVPATVDRSCQWLLNNRASDCWTIVPVTVEESCQPLLNNPTSDC